MARKAKTVSAPDDVVAELRRIVNSGRSEQRLVTRSKIVLGCLAGGTIEQVANELGLSTVTVIKWRNRFEQGGLSALQDAPRSGRAATYGKADEEKIIKTISTPPPDGLARWDGRTLARKLGISADFVWRTVRKHNIHLDRSRSWCVSTDPEFSAKAADIVGLYLAPPDDAIVISIDEKPSMQALSRTTGFVKTHDGSIVRAYQSTYKRNGTLNLFGALEIATGKIYGKCTRHKKRTDFLQFMDELPAELPSGENLTYHVIMDNYCIHKRCDDWLAKHPNVAFHYTPTSASWLNMVEIWFGIMGRKVLKDQSFNCVEQLKEAIEKYIEAYNKYDAHPFQWRKREVRGSQISNTLTNLCN